MSESQNLGSLAGSGAWVRLLGALAALAAGASAVVIGAALLHDLPAVASSGASSLGGSTAASTAVVPATTPATSAGFPAPPRGAVVFGAEAGRRALGLAIVPGKGKLLLQASVIGVQGNGLKGLAVHFDLAGASGQKATATATPCGVGCYRASVSLRRPLRVVVRQTGERPVSFGMPAAWPPPPAAAIVLRAAAAWRKLVTLAFHDSLGDGNVTLHSVWQVVAPDRLAYQVQGEGDSIIIGDHRWDKLGPSGRWIKSSQYPVHQPVPFWVTATEAHLLGTVSYHGRPAWKVSFFDLNGGPAWFTILVDKGTLHTMQLWMTATDHFMHETYGSFDIPIAINPPK